MRVLLVEDDEPLRRLLSRHLSRQGGLVEQAGTRREALVQVQRQAFELLLVDWVLPDGSGLDAIAAYRDGGGEGGVIVITGRRAVEDRVEALGRGADDVLLKPFQMLDLQARIRALRRRPRSRAPGVFRLGNVRVDSEGRSVLVGDRVVYLTPKEWLLLRFLLQERHRVVPRAELVGQAWDDDQEPGAHSLDVHLANLRSKLTAAYADVMIVNRRGAGYQAALADDLVETGA